MSDKNRKDVRLNSKKDALLGRFICRRPRGENVSVECPPDEDIAAFIDGRLGDEARNGIISHMAVCRDCYLLFSDTLKISGSAKENLFTKFRRAAYVILPSLAVAALLFLVLRSAIQDHVIKSPVSAEKTEGGKVAALDKQRPEEGLKARSQLPDTLYKPPFADDLVVRFAGRADLRQLAALIDGHTSPAYGFAETVRPEKSFFLMGLHLTDLEVALRASNIEKVTIILNKLTGELNSMQGAEKVAVYYNEIMKKIESGAPPPQEFRNHSLRTNKERNKTGFYYVGIFGSYKFGIILGIQSLTLGGKDKVYLCRINSNMGTVQA